MSLTRVWTRSSAPTMKTILTSVQKKASKSSSSALYGLLGPPPLFFSGVSFSASSLLVSPPDSSGLFSIPVLDLALFCFLR